MMNQKVFQLIVFMVSCAFIHEVFSLRLDSDKSVPIRGENLILSCLTSNLFDSGIIYWYNPNDIELSRCYYKNGGICDINTSSYIFTANISGAYAYIDVLDRTRDGGKWTCAHGMKKTYENDTINIVIYASPVGVNFVQPVPPDGDLAMQSIILKCQTFSCAFPAPNITWYYMTDGQITPYLGFSGTTVSSTSQCDQLEAVYTDTLILPRGANFSENIPFTTKFVCGVAHQSLGVEIKYSYASNNVTFAVHVSMVNLVHSASGTNVFYEIFPQPLSCISGPSRPVPIIRWLLQTNDTTTDLTNNITETDTTDTNGLHIRTSEITLMLRRDQRDKKIVCTGNIPGQLAVASNTVRINVLYQAHQPNIHEYGEKFPWLENQRGILRCDTSDYGRPTSKVIWIGHRGTTDAGGNLVITELTPNDNEKMIYCQLVNNYTIDKNVTVMSEPITLNIEYSPIIELNTDSPLTVNERQAISVLCSAKGNPDPEQPLWGGRSTDSTLRFNNISRTDTGTYMCEVTANSKKYGVLRNQKTIDIRVQYGAKITNLSVVEKDTVNENGTVTLSCSVDSKPESNITWTKDGTETPLKIDLHMLQSHLVFNCAQCLDASNYTCQASNGVDNPAERRIPLHVNCHPRTDFRSSPVTKVYSKRRGDANLRYTVISYPDPTFAWTFLGNGSEKKAPPNSSVQNDYGQHSTLTFKNLDLEDFGLYSVTAENQFPPSATEVFELAIADVPEAPSSVKIVEVKQKSLTVEWVAGHSGGPEQTFHVVVSADHFTRSVYAADPGYGKVGTAVIEDLTPNTRYNIHISANNTIFASNMTEIIIVYTRNAENNSHTTDMRLFIVGVAALLVVCIVVVISVCITKRRRYPQGTCRKQGKDSSQNNEFCAESSPVISNPVRSNLVNGEHEDMRVSTNDDSPYSEIDDIVTDYSASASISSPFSLPEGDAYEKLHVYANSQDHTYSSVKPPTRIKVANLLFRRYKDKKKKIPPTTMLLNQIAQNK